MSFISIRYKSISTNLEFYEKIYAGSEYFDIVMLAKLLSTKNIDIGKNIYLSKNDLIVVINLMKEEIIKLLIEKQKGLLIGQYPPHAIRNLNVEVLGKEYIFNIRNQWHQYIITLHELYVLFSTVAEEGGEVCFVHV